MRILNHLTRSLLMLAMLAPLSFAGERPTFNKDTCDPRPDILPYWLHDWHVDYRQIYNRPRYWPGRIAHMVEPTSQEAMVWCEANREGLYNGKNCPPSFKQYNFQKPWEILQTGPRPDLNKPAEFPATPSTTSSKPAESNNNSQDSSPSDTTAKPENTQATQAADKVEDKSSSLIKPARAFRF
jgi:hypothetical protein